MKKNGHDIYSQDIPTGLRGIRKCVRCGKHVDSYSEKERNETCSGKPPVNAKGVSSKAK
jgi:hypothetical protein